MTKDRKIIVIICFILITAILILFITPNIINHTKIKKEYFESEVYQVTNPDEIHYLKESHKIISKKETYIDYLEQKGIELDEDDIEEIEEKDYENFNYLLLIIPINSCGEEIDYEDIEIDEENYLLIVNMTLEETCGVCAPEIELYEIKLPKKYKEYQYNVSIDWDREEAHCDPEIAYKPILYLYPKQETNIKINFANENNLTTTYPKFNQEWNVVANSNGDLYDSKGNYYYALYWEEKDYSKINFTEGFYVNKENSINFLEEKLSILGLNKKEKNEFIMYWLPILEKNEHNLIYFELTNELQNQNEIIITPQPDTLIRIRMHVKQVEKETNIKEQQLVKQERIGYTAVEWGGVIHN